jgi:predicted nuclease with TOPRIM domain
VTSKPSGYRQKYLMKSEECEELKRRLGQQHGFLIATNERVTKLEAENLRLTLALKDLALKMIDKSNRRKRK